MGSRVYSRGFWTAAGAGEASQHPVKSALQGFLASGRRRGGLTRSSDYSFARAVDCHEHDRPPSSSRSPSPAHLAAVLAAIVGLLGFGACLGASNAGRLGGDAPRQRRHLPSQSQRLRRGRSRRHRWRGRRGASTTTRRTPRASSTAGRRTRTGATRGASPAAPSIPRELNMASRTSRRTVATRSPRSSAPATGRFPTGCTSLRRATAPTTTSGCRSRTARRPGGCPTASRRAQGH